MYFSKQQQEIYNSIRQWVIDGHYSCGEKFPKEVDLAKQFQVARNTLRPCLEQLVDDNILVRIKRKGTFVSQEALKCLNHKIIGLMMPVLGAELTFSQSPTNYQIFDGIHKYCVEHVWDLQIMQSKLLAFSWEQFSRSNIAGVIVVMPDHSTYKLILELKKRQIPFVCINLNSEKINRDVNYINIDFYNTAIDAVQYLNRENRKNIAVINTRKLRDDELPFHIIDGYKQAVKDLHLKENIINIVGDDDPSVRINEYLKRNIQDVKQYDAFICTYPTAGFYLFNGLKELNVKVPEDISIVTIYDNQKTRRLGINSYDTDLVSVGYESISMLDDMFNDEHKKLRQKEIKLQLTVNSKVI